MSVRCVLRETLGGSGTSENIYSNHYQRQMSQIVFVFFVCMNYASDMKCQQLYHLILPHTTINTSTFLRPL